MTTRTRSSLSTVVSSPDQARRQRSDVLERLIVGGVRRACGSSIVEGQHGKERFLRDLDRPNTLHELLDFLLLLEELALAGDVAAVALRKHVLAHGPHRLARDDIRADRRLDGDLEHLA